MSQIISEVGEPAEAPDFASNEGDDFAYRPVPPLAPIALFLGFCSISGFLGIPCLAIGFVGLLLGLTARWQIARSQGALGGKLVSLLATVLSGVMLASGSAYHVYAYVTELPEGYERVSFIELSKHIPVFSEEGKIGLDPEVEALDGKPIYIKGYMYPTRQRTDISEFVLVKDTGQCCFGGQPKLTDMIAVKLEKGLTVDHREQQLVGVGGVFRARAPVRSGELTALYVLEGTHFK